MRGLGSTEGRWLGHLSHFIRLTYTCTQLHQAERETNGTVDVYTMYFKHYKEYIHTYMYIHVYVYVHVHVCNSFYTCTGCRTLAVSCDGLITIYYTVILMSQVYVHVHAVVTKAFNRQFIGFWMDEDITVRNMYMYIYWLVEGGRGMGKHNSQCFI